MGGSNSLARLLSASRSLIAEELELLLEAGQWAAAHKLLVDSLAPGWFLSNWTKALLGSLRRLVPHSKEIDAGAPGSFRLGAGLYLSYLSLQVGH